MIYSRHPYQAEIYAAISINQKTHYSMFVIDLNSPDQPLYQESGDDSAELMAKAEMIVDAYVDDAKALRQKTAA